jgi:hypothetical protein
MGLLGGIVGADEDAGHFGAAARALGAEALAKAALGADVSVVAGAKAEPVAKEPSTR